MAEHVKVAVGTYHGPRSLGVHLVHWPIAKGLSHALFLAGVQGPVATVLIMLPASLTASILTGWCFHHLIERHFLNTPQLAIANECPTSRRVSTP